MSDLIYRDAAIALGLEEGAYDYVDVYELAKLPSVDAIPVEWIVDYMNRFGFSFAEDIIKRMLELWEKERAPRWT